MKEGRFDKIIDGTFLDRNVHSDVLVAAKKSSDRQKVKQVFGGMSGVFSLRHTFLRLLSDLSQGFQSPVYYLLEI